MKVGWKSLNSQKQAKSFRKNRKMDAWKNRCRFSGFVCPRREDPRLVILLKSGKLDSWKNRCRFSGFFAPRREDPRLVILLKSGVPRGPKWSQGVPSGPKGSQGVPSGPKWSQGVPKKVQKIKIGRNGLSSHRFE